MPRYACQRPVVAVQIRAVSNPPADTHAGCRTLEFHDPDQDPIVADADFVRRWEPGAGAYLVADEYGEASIVQQQVFEALFTRIT